MKAAHYLSLFALLMPVPAAVRAADDAVNVRTISVGFADLDLRSTAGRATLEKRLRSAIRRVCPDNPRLSEEDAGSQRQCRNGARTDAARRMAALLARQQDYLAMQ